MRVLVLLLCVATAGLAQQRVGYGFKFGMPMNQPYFQTFDESKRFTGGGFVEVRIWRPISLEFNPMWRYQGFLFPVTMQQDDPRIDTTLRGRSHVFDFPLVARWTITDENFWQPFVSSGYVRRWRRESVTTNAGELPDVRLGNFNIWQSGFVLTFGVKLDGGTMVFTPEYRYTRAGSLRSDRSHDLVFGIRF
jgi:hypothetical protein